VRVTRAYLAGFGTAGCVLGVCCSVVRDGRRVRRISWLAAGGRTRLARRGGGYPRAREWRARAAAPGLGAAFVTTVVPVTSSVRRAGGAGAGAAHGRQGTHDAGRLGPKLPTQDGSGRSTGTGSGPTGTGGGPTGTGGGPPTTVPPPINPPVTTPRPPGGPGPVIDKVSAAAGDAVSGVGSRLGSAVGGSAGGAVTKIAGGAGGAVSKLGAGVGNPLGP
jgi:hypothetical protein